MSGIFAACGTVMTLAFVSSGATCNVIFPPPPGISITATPAGCGTWVSSTRTLNWVVRFTAVGVDPSATVVWSFSDGTPGAGQSVVKEFDTGDRESSTSGDHAPVNFDVTLTTGSDTVTQTFGIPLRGIPDFVDPFGDTCIPDEEASLHAVPPAIICYAANPPASGSHYSSGTGVLAPVAPKFYDEALQTEQWVHNLEHGSVVLLYDCGEPCTDADLKLQLQALFDSVPNEPIFGQKKMVITRYAGVTGACAGVATFPASGPFLAIAWDVQRAFDTLDTAGIIEFYLRHVNHGPENAPIPP